MAIKMVMGGQFGSEGKGSVSQWLCQNMKFDVAIRTGGVNAGHTCLGADGNVYKMRQLPVSAVSANYDHVIYLPSGSIIDLEVLFSELEWLTGRKTVVISPYATVMDESYIEMEKTMLKSASTFKGMGASRAMKALRLAKIARDEPKLREFMAKLDHDPTAYYLLETAQGWGLSVASSFYPQTTSYNINPYQHMTDADFPWHYRSQAEVWCVIRPYPIRIAGDSGYLADEISWDELRLRHGGHIPTEQTTVTKKTRRVGEFNVNEVRKMLSAVNPDRLVLTFMDYLVPSLDKKELWDAMMKYEAPIAHGVSHIGVGLGKLMSRYEVLGQDSSYEGR